MVGCASVKIPVGINSIGVSSVGRAVATTTAIASATTSSRWGGYCEPRVIRREEHHDIGWHDELHGRRTDDEWLHPKMRRPGGSVLQEEDRASSPSHDQEPWVSHTIAWKEAGTYLAAKIVGFMQCHFCNGGNNVGDTYTTCLSKSYRLIPWSLKLNWTTSRRRTLVWKLRRYEVAYQWKPWENLVFLFFSVLTVTKQFHCFVAEDDFADQETNGMYIFPPSCGNPPTLAITCQLLVTI